MQLQAICLLALCLGASARVGGQHTGPHRRTITQQQRPVIMEGGQISLHGKPMKFSADMEEEEESGEKMIPLREHNQEIANKEHAFSILLLLLICTMISVFAMIQSAHVNLKKNAWSMIDGTAVVVIALTSFSVVQIFFHELAAESPHGVFIMHVLYALTLFIVALVGSYRLRNDKIKCDSFMAVMFWIVLMGKSGAMTHATDKYGSGPQHSSLINFGCVLALAGLMVVTHHLKAKYFPDDKTWYDDVENSLMGGATGGSIAFLAHIWIDSHFPPNADSLSVAAHENIVAKDAWAAITCVLAILLTEPIGAIAAKAEKADRYWYARFVNLINGTVGILPYFAVSVGSGGYICHLVGFPAGTTGAQLISTGVSTFWGFTMVLACSFIPYLKKGAVNGAQLPGLLLGFGGFIAGYGWGSLISSSMGKLNDGWGFSEGEKNMGTVATVLFLNVLAIPVYVNFLKPAVEKAQEAKNTPR